MRVLHLVHGLLDDLEFSQARGIDGNGLARVPKFPGRLREPVQGAQPLPCHKGRQKRDQRGRAEQKDEPGVAGRAA